MWQYILKRLLLMLLTLFLAMCLGFFITRLAPGDPATRGLQGISQGGGGKGGQYLSEEIIEQNRKLYGFDKAWFFTLKIDDRNTFARKQIERLLKPVEYARKRAQIELSQLNTIALPQLIAALEAQGGARERGLILEMLAALTFPYKDQSAYPRDKDDGAQWRVWWASNRELFSDGNAARAVAAFLQNPTPENRAALIAKGALAVPELMARIGDPARESEVTSALAELQGKIWIIVPGKTSAADRADYLWRWKNWYRHDKERFVEFRGWERLHRHVTDTQFGIWFGRMLRWDFGTSYEHKQPVLKLIKERLPVSIQLSLISAFLAYLIAIPIGIFSATHQYSKADMTTTVALFILYSMPSFWVADMCLMFFTGKPFWELFPSRFLHSPGAHELAWWPWIKDWVWHLILPIFCLTYASLAFLSRQMRVSMLETVRQDFIRTARAKGLAERVVICKHALRNSLIPILTLMAGILPELLGGSVIIESIFTIDGMGKLSFDAILNRDYPVINAIIFFSSFLTLLGILISDLSYVLADPRIRYD